MTWKDHIAERERKEAEEAAAIAARQAKHEKYIAALKARQAELEQKLGGVDWLCYMPRTAGSTELITRAESYLEKMRTRIEAEGGKMWLDASHNCQNRIFEISEFRAMHGSVFCRGQFTEQGRKLRHHYRGVSPNDTVFMGDFDLCTSMPRPANCRSTSDMPVAVQAAARSPSARGLAGACCFPPRDPAYGVTGIYRLTNDKKRMIETTPLSP